MGQNIGPIGRAFEITQVGLEFVRQNLQRGRLADTVGTHQPENLAGSGCRQTMELEGIGTAHRGGMNSVPHEPNPTRATHSPVAMRCILLQIAG